jgi:hypothetical protein
MRAGDSDDDDTCCFCLPGSCVDRLGARIFRSQPGTGEGTSRFWRELPSALLIGWQCSPPGGWLSCCCGGGDEATEPAARTQASKASEGAAASWQPLHETADPLTAAWDISDDDVDLLARAMEDAASRIQHRWRYHRGHQPPRHLRGGALLRGRFFEAASHQLRSQRIVALPHQQQQPPPPAHISPPPHIPPLPHVQPPPQPSPPPPAVQPATPLSSAMAPLNESDSPSLAVLIDELEQQLAVSTPQVLSPYDSKPAAPLHAPALPAGAARPQRHPSPNPSALTTSTDSPSSSSATLASGIGQHAMEYGEVFYV